MTVEELKGLKSKREALHNDFARDMKRCKRGLFVAIVLSVIAFMACFFAGVLSFVDGRIIIGIVDVFLSSFNVWNIFRSVKTVCDINESLYEEQIAYDALIRTMNEHLGFLEKEEKLMRCDE